jgi:hypothetical protein
MWLYGIVAGVKKKKRTRAKASDEEAARLRLIGDKGGAEQARRVAAMPAEERRARFSAMGRARWAKVGEVKRRCHGKALAAARVAKFTHEQLSEQATRGAVKRWSRVREQREADVEQEPAEKAGRE